MQNAEPSLCRGRRRTIATAATATGFVRYQQAISRCREKYRSDVQFDLVFGTDSWTEEMPRTEQQQAQSMLRGTAKEIVCVQPKFSSFDQISFTFTA